MVDFFLWRRPYNLYLLVIGVIVGVEGIFVMCMPSQDWVEKSRQSLSKNQEQDNIWFSYCQAKESGNKIVDSLEKYDKIPIWSKTKIRQVISDLIEFYDLRLRDYHQDVIVEKTYGSMLPIRISLGAGTDVQIFQFLDHVNRELYPWVKLKGIVIQRCGTVEEDGEKLMNEDLVEARLEMNWLLQLKEEGESRES